MLVTAYAASLASREGFVEFGRARAAYKLRYQSAAHMENDLQQAQAIGLITDLVIGRERTSLKMLEPADRYQVDGKEISDDLFGISATVYAEIMQYWNQIAARNTTRLVPTANIEPSIDQISAMKRAWQNSEFKAVWKKSIRILAVSSYYDGRRVAFMTWIGRNREKTTLFALQSMRIFEEDQPSLTNEDHLVLYPEPKGWGLTNAPWSQMLTRDREEVYTGMERVAKQAV